MSSKLKVVAVIIAINAALVWNVVLGSYVQNETQYQNSIPIAEFPIYDESEGQSRQISPLYSYDQHLTRPKVVKQRIKARMVENTPGMNDDHDQYAGIVGSERGQVHPQRNSFLPTIMMYGPTAGHVAETGHYAPNFGQMHSYMKEIDAKEAALKGFGIGLAIGLAALGGFSGILKVLWIPLLALGALLPLLALLLSVPIPVATSGKTLMSGIGGIGKGKESMQEIIEEVMKKLPDLKSHINKTTSMKT